MTAKEKAQAIIAASFKEVKQDLARKANAGQHSPAATPRHATSCLATPHHTTSHCTCYRSLGTTVVGPWHLALPTPGLSGLRPSE